MHDAERERQAADRYADLPEETREFLETLRPDEIILLFKAIKFMSSAETMGRFGKWALMLGVGAFLTMVALGEGWRTFVSWFKGPS